MSCLYVLSVMFPSLLYSLPISFTIVWIITRFLHWTETSRRFLSVRHSESNDFSNVFIHIFHVPEYHWFSLDIPRKHLHCSARVGLHVRPTLFSSASSITQHPAPSIRLGTTESCCPLSESNVVHSSTFWVTVWQWSCAQYAFVGSKDFWGIH